MTGMTYNYSSGNTGGMLYVATNPDGFSRMIVQSTHTAMQAVTLVQNLDEISAGITRRPDHEFNADEDGFYCQDCPNGSLYSDDRGAHLYVIREWEIG